jgi:CBS domain containing-hemolysin-like protein
MLLDDFLEMIDFDEELESESTTVGGFVTERLGRLPVENDRVEFDGHVITVLEMANLRVERIKVEMRKDAD